MDTRNLESSITSSANAIVNMERGTIVPHLVLGQLLESDVKSKTYYQRVIRLKKFLENNHHIFMRTETKLGYYICKPGEEIHGIAGAFMQGIGRMRKQAVRTRNIILDGMTQEDQSRTIQTSQSMATILAGTQAGARKELATYQKPLAADGSCNVALLELAEK